MAADSQTLTLEPGAWCQAADHWLSQTGSAGDLLDYKLQHESGASLFYVKAQGQIVGAFLLRVDTSATGSEGVIVAAAAALDGVDMIASCIPAIEKLFVNCERVRYHTKNAALARKLGRMGYTGAEIVCMKEINQNG